MSGAPQRTGKPAGPVTLTGRLLAWKAGTPVLLRMAGAPDAHYLACFSTPMLLERTMARLGASFDKIKRVDDGNEFLRSIPAAITVIVDPYWTDEGRVRFTQLLRD